MRSGLRMMNGKPRSTEAQLYEYEVELRRMAGELARLRAERQHVRSMPRSFAPHYAAIRNLLALMQDSKFWRLRNTWFALRHALRLHPTGPTPIHVLPEDPEDLFLRPTPYELWLQRNELRASDIARIREMVALMPRRPTFSILMPVYNTPELYLREAIESVIRQAYPYWQLCIADDASTAPYVRNVLDEYAVRDSRIDVSYRSQNGHMAKASNTALSLARGEFIGLLDHDDLLTPDALFENAVVINYHPTTDMIYSDEDKLDNLGRRYDPYFKPDWSPDTFLTRMYTCHFGVYRRSLVEEIGGFREGFEGSQDYDLVLRLTERTQHIRHIPRVLYHWRIHAGSVTSTSEQKPYAYVAALRALNEALERRGEAGRVEDIPGLLGFYVVRYDIVRPGRVSVIIPTRDHAEDLQRCLGSLFEKTQYPDYEVVVIDNGSTEFGALEVLRTFEQREASRLRVLRHDVPFNFSEINNFGVRNSTGSYLVFLNNDTEILEGDWLTAMMRQAQRPSVGAVGAKLLYADDTVQHAGVVIGIGGIAGHSHRQSKRDDLGYFNALATVQNYSAVTAACMMMRREVFDEVGGFDERLKVAYNDVDLCLRLREAGYLNVFLPYVVLHHFESKSRGYDVTPDKWARDETEREFMQARWNIGQFVDPFYNPNLTLDAENFAIAQEPRYFQTFEASQPNWNSGSAGSERLANARAALKDDGMRGVGSTLL